MIGQLCFRDNTAALIPMSLTSRRIALFISYDWPNQSENLDVQLFRFLLLGICCLLYFTIIYVKDHQNYFKSLRVSVCVFVAV